MDANKYNRSVTLICPTCGGDQFEYDDAEQPVASVKCVSCERAFTKEELIDLNRENVSSHVDDMKQEITRDFAREMRATMKSALRGNKHIKFR